MKTMIGRVTGTRWEQDDLGQFWTLIVITTVDGRIATLQLAEDEDPSPYMGAEVQLTIKPEGR